MLENIRSHYITQIVFSILKSTKTYNLVKYNKSLINKLNINPLYFKLLSRKYVIYGKNRIAREYNIYTDYLLYEGEYLNGKRNGKGKEYVYDKISFEGEYLNNEKYKGREYLKGKLEFEGEYFSNRKWDGNGYDEKGNIIYLMAKKYMRVNFQMITDMEKEKSMMKVLIK